MFSVQCSVKVAVDPMESNNLSAVTKQSVKQMTLSVVLASSYQSYHAGSCINFSNQFGFNYMLN